MIKSILATDCYKVEKLELSVLGTTLGADFIFQEISSNPFAYYKGIFIHQQLIAYVSSRVLDDAIEILNIVVDKAYQGNTFGTKLMQDVVDVAKEKKVKHIILEVRKQNKRAIKFYERFGFEIAYVKKNYYQNEDGLVMLKEVE